MRRTLILAWALALALVLSATAAAKPIGPHYRQRATVYSTSNCDSYSPSSTTADGSSLYAHSDAHRGGVIASNALPMHTLIRMDHVLFGHRYYRVRDTGGGGAGLLDVFVPCSRLDPSWGRVVGFRVVRWGG